MDVHLTLASFTLFSLLAGFLLIMMAFQRPMCRWVQFLDQGLFRNPHHFAVPLYFWKASDKSKHPHFGSPSPSLFPSVFIRSCRGAVTNSHALKQRKAPCKLCAWFPIQGFFWGIGHRASGLLLTWGATTDVSTENRHGMQQAPIMTHLMPLRVTGETMSILFLFTPPVSSKGPHLE